jgi:hypothetical protein
MAATLRPPLGSWSKPPPVLQATQPLALSIRPLADRRQGRNSIQIATGKGKDRKEQMILELRIGGGGKGAQTVFPGSVHETGELIAWDEKENIARAEGDSLDEHIVHI